MNSKPLPKLANKDRPSMKSMKPPINSSLLIKDKGKLPPALQKNAISKTTLKSINSTNSKVEQETILPEFKMKALEPKVKPFNPKIKQIDPKMKTFDSKIKPFEPKIKPIEPDVKPTESKIKPKLPELKSKLPELKSKIPELKSKLPESKPKSPELKPKPSDSRVKLPEPKLKSVEPEINPNLSKHCNSADSKQEKLFNTVKEEYPKSILLKTKSFEKKNFLDKVRNISLKSKNVEKTNPYETIEKGKFYPSLKEKTKVPTSPVIEKRAIIKKEISSLDNEAAKNILSNEKGIQQKFLGNKNISTVDISIQRKESNFKAPVNSYNQVEQTEVYINSISKNNTMIGIDDETKQIGPLSTFKESKLVRNTHYINAFSRFDGNYIGKVTGPPAPISNLDKNPQNHNEKKEFQNEHQINNFSNNAIPFVDYSFMANFPLYNFNNNLRNGNIANPPFCFYPGMCIPLYPYDPNYYQSYFMNNLNEPEEKKEKEEINNNKEKEKNKKKKNIDDNTMIAAGHLKPLQFRNGAEWSSEDERYLNADIYLEEEEKKKKGNKSKSRSKYIGNSQWYEIERKLNNSRGVIEDREEDYTEDDEDDNGDCSEDDNEDDSEDYNENDNKRFNDEKLKKKKNTYLNKLKKKKKYKNIKKNLDDSDDINFDDIYKNYKIEYLKEKLKWANEYLKKKRINEEINDSCSITYNPLRKKHIERLDDVSHIFLPKNKKYQNLFDLAMNFSKISNDDKNDIINILLSCRELEKLIEEQHCVLDMLDNDLKEVNASLKLPSKWDNFENFELLQENILNSEEKGLPLNNTPLFIKGKVSLIPKNLDTFFDEIEPQNKKEIPKEPVNTNTEKNTTTNIKFTPKIVKYKTKTKMPLLLKNISKQ